MLEWYADQDIQSAFSKCWFLRLAITASSHFHSSSLALVTASFSVICILISKNLWYCTSVAYYTSIMLNTLRHLLCSLLCQHNQWVSMLKLLQYWLMPLKSSSMYHWSTTVKHIWLSIQELSKYIFEWSFLYSLS